MHDHVSEDWLLPRLGQWWKLWSLQLMQKEAYQNLVPEGQVDSCQNFAEADREIVPKLVFGLRSSHSRNNLRYYPQITV